MWLHRCVVKSSMLRYASQVNNLKHSTILFESVLLKKCQSDTTGKKVLSFDNHTYGFKHPQPVCSSTLRTQCTLARARELQHDSHDITRWRTTFWGADGTKLWHWWPRQLRHRHRCLLTPRSDTHHYLSSSRHLPTSFPSAISKLFHLDTLNPGCRFSN